MLLHRRIAFFASVTICVAATVVARAGGEVNESARALSRCGDHVPKNLIAPPQSETETSVTLIWDPPSEDERGLSYEVYRDGAPVGTTAKNCQKL